MTGCNTGRHSAVVEYIIFYNLKKWKTILGPHQPLQQNVFLVTKISEKIFFDTKNIALVTKYEFRH